MGRTEFLTLTIRSEPRLESAKQPRERNGALQQECMHSCAHTVIDTADIVRDDDLSPTEPSRGLRNIADQFYLIALGIGDIERPPMYPRVFSGFDLKPQ